MEHVLFGAANKRREAGNALAEPAPLPVVTSENG